MHLPDVYMPDENNGVVHTEHFLFSFATLHSFLYVHMRYTDVSDHIFIRVFCSALLTLLTFTRCASTAVDQSEDPEGGVTSWHTNFCSQKRVWRPSRSALRFLKLFMSAAF